MVALLAQLRRLAEERGQTLVEYSLIIAFVAIALLGAVGAFGNIVQVLYEMGIALFPAP